MIHQYTGAIPMTDAAPASPAVDPADYLKWARTVARGVRRDFRFGRGSQEEQDLEAVAYLELVEAAKRYRLARLPPGVQVGDHFRGYAVKAIRNKCKREAIRLRNGGTYHTRREWEHAGPLEVEPLPRCGNCSDVWGTGECDPPLSSDGRRPEVDEPPQESAD